MRKRAMFVMLVIGIFSIVVSSSHAAITLANVEVLETGEFRSLDIGEAVFFNYNNPGNVNRWLDLPAPLDDPSLEFWYNDYDPSISASWEAGIIDFRVLTNGPVWLVVTERWGGGGGHNGIWENELTTQAQLIAEGWSEITNAITGTADGINPNIGYLLYERQSLAGEEFSIRTEKYIAPIPLIGVIPESAVLLGLEIVGPNAVAEDSQTQYKAIAHYDNNSTVDVTDSADCVWSIEPNDIADIDAGLLETGDIDKAQDVTITAEYTEGDVNEVTEKQVSILAICPSGSALEFDGVDDYVDVGNDVSINSLTTFSVCAWFKADAVPFISYAPYLVSQRDLSNTVWVFGFQGDISDKLFSTIITDGTDPYAVAEFIPDADIWYHAAMTYDDGGDRKIRLYINGDEVSYMFQTAATGTILSNPSVNIAIGNRIGSGRDFDGELDEVKIFDKVLSVEEIQSLMHTRPDTGEPNLVGYWDFDEGEGIIAHDSAHGNHGELSSSEYCDPRDVECHAEFYPKWVESDAPVGICTYVGVDIKPGSCPNPLNLASRGVLPVAILGAEDFDVTTIDAGSIFLEGVSTIRTSYEDVAAPVVDGNECECTTDGPDGYTDLTLKFKTQDIVEELIDTPGDLAEGQTLALTLSGELEDGTAILGTDCVVLVGNVSKWLLAKDSDINKDDKVDFLDLAELANNWLQSAAEQ